jgi:hypothetical protein
MQILQNVITPPTQSYAALSQYRQQQVDQFPQIEANAFQQMHDRQHIRQQRRAPHRGLVQNNSSQTQFDLRQHRVRRNGAGRRGNRSWRRSQNWRRNRSWRRTGRRRRESGNLRRQTAGAKAGKLPPEVASRLLCPSRLRPIVGPTPLPRTQPTPMLAAAERTTQVAPARIPAMGEKADAAADAGNHANGQFRMRLDSRL